MLEFCGVLVLFILFFILLYCAVTAVYNDPKDLEKDLCKGFLAGILWVVLAYICINIFISIGVQHECSTPEVDGISQPDSVTTGPRVDSLGSNEKSIARSA
jgi:hypothetical protein